MSDTDALVAFLEARLGEAEQVIRKVSDQNRPYWHPRALRWKLDEQDAGAQQQIVRDAQGWSIALTNPTVAAYMLAHDPQWALDDIATKRAILTAHGPVLLRKGGGADYYVTALVCATCGGTDTWYDDMTKAPNAAKHPCPTLRWLAWLYRRHADWLPEWAPEGAEA